MILYKGFLCHPTVCCVGDKYQIMVSVKERLLVSVRVGKNEYFNHSNGIRISDTKIHRITVPMNELDKEKKYTVVCRKMIWRKPYFPKTGEEITIDYTFKPLTKTNDINIYHIADSHSNVSVAVEAAKRYSNDLDLLILNGDIAGTSESIKEICVAYKIASEITGGSIPCIISRGNHDLRGKCAPRLAEYMPVDNGKSYYTTKIGNIWVILVDTGEDKADTSPEYGNTIACHQFRREETQFIENVIANNVNEYNADDVKYRFVISHVPFSYKVGPPPFDIEQELFTQWCKTIKDNIRPQLMLCGHMHYYEICEPGGKHDTYGQPCTMLIGSAMKNSKSKNPYFVGMGLKLNNNTATVTFNSKDEIIETKEIKLNV